MFFKNIKITNKNELGILSDKILKICNILDKKFSIKTTVELGFADNKLSSLQLLPKRGLTLKSSPEYLSTYVESYLVKGDIFMDIYFEK